ncbi:MAG: nicotinamidase [Candidatus Fermentibacteraceae bacterium]
MQVDRDSDALIVTDVQYDFLPGGALGVEGGDRVIPVINRLMPLFEHVVLSRDWHPAGHVSFSRAPEFVDKSWPRHCVRGTRGAEFHRDLEKPERALVVSKATDPEKEAYSCFQGTGLAGELRDRGVERVFVTGLATDYCVRWTARDALKNGFHAVVVSDAVAGIDVPEGNVKKAVSELKEQGAVFVDSSEIVAPGAVKS